MKVYLLMPYGWPCDGKVYINKTIAIDAAEQFIKDDDMNDVEDPEELLMEMELTVE